MSKKGANKSDKPVAPDLVDAMNSVKTDAQEALALDEIAETAEVSVDNTLAENNAPDPIEQATSLKAFGLGLLIAAIVIILDQWAKQLATAQLELYRSQPVFEWLNMTLAHNRGAAFSFLSNAGGWQRWFFSILAAGISVMLLVWMFRLPARERVSLWALALVLGGAIGNLIDRLRFGYVVDFIDAHLGASHWPAFNIADSAISVGVVLLILGMFLYPQNK